MTVKVGNCWRSHITMAYFYTLQFMSYFGICRSLNTFEPLILRPMKKGFASLVFVNKIKLRILNCLMDASIHITMLLESAQEMFNFLKYDATKYIRLCFNNIKGSMNYTIHKLVNILLTV